MDHRAASAVGYAGVLAIFLVVAIFTPGWVWEYLFPPPEPGSLMDAGIVTVSDQASVDLAGRWRVVLPYGATVQRTGETGTIDLYMEKHAVFAAPVEPVAPATVRRNMGCAFNKNGELVIATFGEWGSWPDIGYISLVVCVPESVDVVRQVGLSGPESVANGSEYQHHRGRDQNPWPGPAEPADGWTRIPDTSDPQRRAENE
ncbi:MAG: hypothetical protein ACLFTN_09415 [Phycisphaerae bacterium]